MSVNNPTDNTERYVVDVVLEKYLAAEGFDIRSDRYINKNKYV